MGDAAQHSVFHPFTRHSRRSARASAIHKPRFLQRVFGAIVKTREQELDRQVAAALARSGGRFTDSIERNMYQRHIFGSSWDGPA